MGSPVHCSLLASPAAPLAQCSLQLAVGQLFLPSVCPSELPNQLSLHQCAAITKRVAALSLVLLKNTHEGWGDLAKCTVVGGFAHDMFIPTRS